MFLWGVMGIYNSNRGLLVKSLNTVFVLLLVFCLICTEVQAIVIYDMAPKVSDNLSTLNVDVDTFSLSPELGTIKYVHKVQVIRSYFIFRMRIVIMKVRIVYMRS